MFQGCAEYWLSTKLQTLPYELELQDGTPRGGVLHLSRRPHRDHTDHHGLRRWLGRNLFLCPCICLQLHNRYLCTILHIHVLCRNSMFFYIDRTLIEITLSSLSRVRSCAKPFARPGETPGNSSGNLGKTSPYSPYIAPGCSLGSSH